MGHRDGPDRARVCLRSRRDGGTDRTRHRRGADSSRRGRVSRSGRLHDSRPRERDRARILVRAQRAALVYQLRQGAPRALDAEPGDRRGPGSVRQTGADPAPARRLEAAPEQPGGAQRSGSRILPAGAGRVRDGSPDRAAPQPRRRRARGRGGMAAPPVHADPSVSRWQRTRRANAGDPGSRQGPPVPAGRAERRQGRLPGCARSCGPRRLGAPGDVLLRHSATRIRAGPRAVPRRRPVRPRRGPDPIHAPGTRAPARRPAGGMEHREGAGRGPSEASERRA